jgi:hypothetical protein
MNPNQWPWVTDNMTFVSPLGLGVTMVMGILLIILPRKHALIPILALTCFMTMGQRVLIFGLNFTMIRILIFLGWLRLGDDRSLSTFVALDELRGCDLSSWPGL